jgi:hypothetical protein
VAGIGRPCLRSAARRTKSWWVLLVAVGLAVAMVGGCGPSERSGASLDRQAVKVRYKSMHEGGESGGTPQVLQVLAEGDRFRMSISDAATPEDAYQTMVWDGRTMLLLEGEDASREENPPADQRPPSYFMRVGDPTFDRLCHGGVRQGSAQVAGRSGTVYTCPAQGTGDTASEASQITLDDETGLLLRSASASSHTEAVEVELGVAVDETTFSTEVPDAMRGPEDETDDSGAPLPLTGVDTVPKAGGGELHLADIRHGPSLVVIGELPGVTDMLTRVLPKTKQGSAPRVYVLLNPIPFTEEEPENPDLSLATEEGTMKLIAKVSSEVAGIPVPVGIDIKGGAAGEDLRPFDDIMAGTTVLAAIDESGALAWRMNEQELAQSSDPLDNWIASTT